ncbi:hypothetical protein [Myroides injenensis]|uniref:hypothetical protein n=1 Tax=Myroides injenensis TaxID=1183151 RepID=UPI00028925D8|nr:hypothetical protein [Myroides injenensis]
MAKNIKKIICPQCGSNQIKEVKEDNYRCLSCNTYFFLDSDDININHNYNHSYPKNNKVELNKLGKAMAIGLFSFFIIFALMRVVTVLFSADDSLPDTAIPTVVKAPEPPARMINLGSIETGLVSKDSINTFIVQVGVANDIFAKSNQNRLFMMIVDGNSGKEIKRHQIELNLSNKGADASSSVSTNFFYDADNNLYLIVNNYYLLKFNIGLQRFELVKDDFFTKHVEFADGVANLEYKDFDKALEVTTHVGKRYYYYLDLDKVYSNKEYSNVYQLKLPHPEKRVGFLFSEKSHEFPDEDIQLIKYEYWYQKGYPQGSFFFSWRKNYGRSGIFTSRDPYQKVLIMPYSRKIARIIKEEDFTKDRKYVKGMVIGSDSEGVIIGIKQSIMESETFTLQKLNINNGKILWSKKTDWERLKIVKELEGRYLIEVGYQKYVVMDEKGNYLCQLDDSHLKVEEEKEK